MITKNDAPLAAADAHILVFGTRAGEVAILSEKDVGGPLVIELLAEEAFRRKSGTARIPAARLRERLPKALALLKSPGHAMFGECDDAHIAESSQRIIDFVEAVEEEEKARGESLRIFADR